MQVHSETKPQTLQREEVIKLLQCHQEELRGFGVRSLALFGSVVRNQARPDSDVDLLVELEQGVTLFGFARLNRYLEEILGTKVDLVMRDVVIKERRERIYGEAVNIPLSF